VDKESLILPMGSRREIAKASWLASAYLPTNLESNRTGDKAAGKPKKSRTDNYPGAKDLTLIIASKSLREFDACHRATWFL